MNEYHKKKQLENIIKEVREKINNFDVFKEFTFPLMKREEENQVKSSIDYEWRKSIKEPLLKILDKVGDDKEWNILKQFIFIIKEKDKLYLKASGFQQLTFLMEIML